jgi:acetyl-CoA acetyltransferase
VETYMSSPMISSPICLYDCDVPVDVSSAFVVSAIDTAPDLRAPVRINAVSTAMRGRPHYTEWEDMTTMVSHELVKQLWTRTELTVDDIDTAQLYDGFSIITLLWLEALGVCGRGEAGAFIEGGERISLGGQLPINTWGGQMSAGRLHGFGYPAEAMRQLRGEATGRQVLDAEVALAGVGAAHWGGAMLLTRW